MKPHYTILVLLLLLTTLASGCATRPDRSDTIAYAAYVEANDPIEPLNRYFFELTRFFDFLFLKPISNIYKETVPVYPRRMLSNFYSNLREPIYFVNNMMQGSFKRGGTNLGRFFANSVLGLGGLFDISSAWFDTGPAPEDFGQTLAVYGVPEGPYLFLPFLGPSSMRDAIGTGMDTAIDPFNYITRVNGVKEFRQQIDAVIMMRIPITVLELRSSSGAFLDQIEAESIDFYARVRQFYRQNRKNAILNGEIDFDSLPDIPDDDFFDTEP